MNARRNSTLGGSQSRDTFAGQIAVPSGLGRVRSVRR